MFFGWACDCTMRAAMPWLLRQKDEEDHGEDFITISQFPHSCTVSVGNLYIPRIGLPFLLHTATAIPFIYSFSGNCAASATISTFICLWAIYIFPWSVHIFPPAEKANTLWEYIIRSQTHVGRNWDWGPDIPFLGIFFSNFRHFVSAVQQNRQ